jgi:ubiquinone/menaquinone biosynthesis C-methylase UbiE
MTSSLSAQTTRARILGRWAARIVARRFPRRFGLLEVLAIGSVEWMRRHLAIINALEAIRTESQQETLRVLDFGGAGGSLARALDFYGLSTRYRLILADIDNAAISTAIIRPPTERAVLIDPDGPLPFDDGEFDVVVSSDVFEHIPRGARARWAAELERVCRLGQVHSMPADSGDGRWTSTLTDIAFDRWYFERFGFRERWTVEHLEAGLPTIEMLREIFPSSRISGISNSSVWLESMRAQFGPKHPAARGLFALAYFTKLRRLESRPPFKNCLVIVGATSRPVGT